jgi:hypothetical protein
MRKLSFIILLLFVTVAFSLTGCLKADRINLDPAAAKTIVTMEYLAGGGGTTIGSGLSYFSGAALLFPPTDEADTLTFTVILAGGVAIDKDVTVTVAPDPNALLDNFASDSINYAAMPDSVYHLVSNTATIPAGGQGAEFQLIVNPSKIDPLQNYMLPFTVTDAGGYTLSSNYGHIYFHTIGNPIAGVYSWDFTRWDNNTGTGDYRTDLSWIGDQTVFAPVSNTGIKVKTGYYTQPNYVISFDNNNGVLSNFSVAFDPVELKTDFTDNGLTVLDGPNLTVSDDQKTFTVQYMVTNGSAYRYLVDKYYK